MNLLEPTPLSSLCRVHAVGDLTWLITFDLPVAVLAVERLLDLVVWALLLGVVVLLIAVMLVVEVLGLLLGGVLRFLTIDEVGTLGLGELVDLGTSNASNDLLGEAVGHLLACDCPSVLALSYGLHRLCVVCVGQLKLINAPCRSGGMLMMLAREKDDYLPSLRW